MDDILPVRRGPMQKPALFCRPQVLRSMTRSAGDEKFKRALLACVAGAGFFLGRRKKSRGRATQARAL